ncbi:amidase [Limimaricola hongkongensis]|uniref:Amidase n=1 Tax=Limimaricola hongkongensis DSM 17492 TaxID=1122180 RepID=A0A017HG60_9RHOB|nr:amidase family protein [Limimaricola hongkongensis]EYD72784.1 Amidase [Limimaricola hongkongensis DSM 17492]
MLQASLEHIARGLRDGTLSAAALMAEATARHAATEDRLNAYKCWDGARAARQAGAIDTLIATGADLGPMMGLPVSVKDLYGVPGLPVFAGTDTEFPKEWRRAGPLVRRLLDQLCVVTGKTHTVEFAFGGLGTNPHWGAPVNPWSAPGAPRAAGGSSSGAGVSLAQGSALAALGTDTAGSVRIPASFTGQTALKTTHGRWSGDGIVPLSPSMDTPGLLARTVADLAYLFAAVEGRARVAPRAPGGLRIGIVTNLVWDDIDPVIAETTRAAIARLERAGARLVEVELPHLDRVLDIFRRGGLGAPELRGFLEGHFPERIARLDPAVRVRVDQACEITAADYLQRRETLSESGRAAARAFEGIDLMVTPTVPISAPLLADLDDPETYRHSNMMALRNTAIVNLLGWCALTLPTGLDGNGIPTGLQIIAPPHEEERLLAAGLGAEAVLGAAPELLGPPPL